MSLQPVQNWNDKGNASALVAAIEAAGISLANVGGVWMASDPVAAQAIIDAFDPLPMNRAGKLMQVDGAFGAKLASGYSYGGKLYQIDPDSIANINAMGALAIGVLSNASGAQPWPDGFYWIAADNSHTPMDAEGCYTFAQAVAGYVSALILKRRALKDAVAAAATQADLDAIDIAAGLS